MSSAIVRLGNAGFATCHTMKACQINRFGVALAVRPHASISRVFPGCEQGHAFTKRKVCL